MTRITVSDPNAEGRRLAQADDQVRHHADIAPCVPISELAP